MSGLRVRILRWALSAGVLMVLGYGVHRFDRLHDFPPFLLIANCEAKGLEFRMEDRSPFQTDAACLLRKMRSKEFFLPEFYIQESGEQVAFSSVIDDLTAHYFFCKTPMYRFVDPEDAHGCAEAMRRSMHWVMDQQLGILRDPRRPPDLECSPLHVALDAQDELLWRKLIEQGSDPDDVPATPCVNFNELHGIGLDSRESPIRLKQVMHRDGA